MREDLLMCLYANLAGMAIYFPLLFRMKFRFTNKTLLMAAAAGVLVCNLAAPYITFLRLLIVGLGALLCYLLGYYFTLSADIHLSQLYLPTACRGFAYAVLSATFMVCLEEIMTFQHFFQALSVFNMLHMVVGGVMGAASPTTCPTTWHATARPWTACPSAGPPSRWASTWRPSWRR